MAESRPESDTGPTANPAPASGVQRLTWRLPPVSFFLVSAVFHYLGPAFAVLLFARVEVLGVAWLRIVGAGAVYALWRRPWRFFARLSRRERSTLLAMGAVLAAMNSVFYLAIARLPLGTVGAIEFLGPVGLAALGARTRKNWLALAFASAGAYLLTEVRFVLEPLGYLFAFANCCLFVLYVVLGHRMSRGRAVSGVDQLALAMLVASVAVTPVGLLPAAPALIQPTLLAAGVGVGVCSSVIPYVCDQLAMARLPRATFALLLSLLPVTATVVGLLVLRQVPRPPEALGILLVMAGVGLHRGVDAT